MDYDIYGDIARRTDGDIYIGVVGPVRTGKSTFITKFMEEIVLPNMAEKKKSVAVDEMPQSASGKTVMTTEPKFVPSSAVQINVGNMTAKVRLIDCVGYMVEGALGGEENGETRLISTPWQASPMPFSKAAEYGTKKVITDHSTIGVLVTADGSFTDLKRSDYESVEKEVVNQLKSLNKPFIVVFNSSKPDDEKVKKECAELQNKYGVAVIPADLSKINKEGLERILSKLLEEFPLRSVDLDIPKWMQALPIDGKILSYTLSKVKDAVKKVSKMKDSAVLETMFDGSDIFEPISEASVDMATGTVSLECKAMDGVFFKALSEASGEEVADETALMNYVKDLTEAKRNYYKLKDALSEAEANGYGIVHSEFTDCNVGEPQVVKKAGQYCVRMRVDSKSLHIIRADINQEVDPVFGSKEQCENFLTLMEKDGYDATVFGRPLSDILSEELQKKCEHFPDNLRVKLKRVVTKAVNEKKSGMICVLI